MRSLRPPARSPFARVPALAAHRSTGVPRIFVNSAPGPLACQSYKIEVVKAKGEFVWHTHPDTDDFFLVLAGRLTIQLRDRAVELGPGELFVVPRGVEHCPKADVETHVLLIEPAGTPNTGDAGGERTAPEERI